MAEVVNVADRLRRSAYVGAHAEDLHGRAFAHFRRGPPNSSTSSRPAPSVVSRLFDISQFAQATNQPAVTSLHRCCCLLVPVKSSAYTRRAPSTGILLQRHHRRHAVLAAVSVLGADASPSGSGSPVSANLSVIRIIPREGRWLDGRNRRRQYSFGSISPQSHPHSLRLPLMSGPASAIAKVRIP